MNSPPVLDDDNISVTAAASVSSSSSSSTKSDEITLESLLSSHSDGTTDIDIKREKLRHYARLLGISEESLREHIDDSSANDEQQDNESDDVGTSNTKTMTNCKSFSSMPSSEADDSINMSYSSSSKSSSTEADGSLSVYSTNFTCATPSSHQQRTVMRRPSCVSSICSASVLESIPEEDDMMSHENEEEDDKEEDQDESPTDNQSAASSIPPLPSTITTTVPTTTTTRMPRRSSVGKPPLIPSTPSTSTAMAIDAPANGDEEDCMYDDDDDDDDDEEEALSGVSLLIEDLYPNAFDSAPSRTASRDDDSTNGSVDARSVATAETDGDVSTKSKPDPPESPVEAAKLRSRGGSPDSMHIDATLEVTPIIGNRARKGSTESIHIDDMFFDNDLHVLTSSESGNRERKGTLESMEVIIPDDFESAASNLSSCGVSDYQKYHHALLTQFLASPDLMGGSSPRSTDDLQGQAKSAVLLREQHQDTEGNQIAKMIVELNSRLAKIDSGLNAGTCASSMAAETISELSTTSKSSKKSAASDASSVLLNIVKDVKLELADVNMNFDAYRMKQRHLTEENQLLTRQKAHLEEQLDAITKDRDELRSELKMTLCIMSAEQKKLREALIAQTQLRVELEASQIRLLEASKSEKKANLTMMNMMQHRRNSSDSEIFDFDPDIINKKNCDGDEVTVATQDVTCTNYESRRSIYSTSMSTIDSGSRRSLGNTPPPRGLLRRFSNMFGNSNDDMDTASTTSATPSCQKHSRRHSADGCIRSTTSDRGDDDASHTSSDSTRFGGQKKGGDPRPRHMRRASISGCDYSSMSTSSIVGQQEVEGTIPLALSSKPRQSMKMFHASTRSINTHNDVQSFLGKLDLMEDVDSAISGPAISGSAA